MLYPLKFKPIYKEKIWGGHKFHTLLHKEECAEIPQCGESWEVSGFDEEPSVVTNGFLAGNTLNELIEVYMGDLVGEKVFHQYGQVFPLLVKFIDAQDDLSVQVHPDDELAQKLGEPNGKTEMWYVIDAAPGSELVYGFNEELSKDEFRKAIEDNTLMEKLRRVPVKQGDVFFIEPGTLHAIGKGILIAEIQQSSNVTYRVYDYGRLGADGKPRPLHIEKALEVTNTKPLDPERPVYGLELDGVVTQLLADCQYFNVNRHRLIKELELYADKNSFAHVLMIGGSGGELVADNYRLELTMGSSVFVPAGTGAFAIKGNCDVIVTTIQ